QGRRCRVCRKRISRRQYQGHRGAPGDQAGQPLLLLPLQGRGSRGSLPVRHRGLRPSNGAYCEERPALRGQAAGNADLAPLELPGEERSAQGLQRRAPVPAGREAPGAEATRKRLSPAARRNIRRGNTAGSDTELHRLPFCRAGRHWHLQRLGGPHRPRPRPRQFRRDPEKRGLAAERVLGTTQAKTRDRRRCRSRHRSLKPTEGFMAEQKATNVTWHSGDVSREDRYEILRQKGATIWFTGLSGSGKSTIAVALERALFGMGKLSYRLDGDNVRLGINKNLGFSEADRKENIRRIGEVAKLFGDAGTIALSSFISPYKGDRDEVRELHNAAGLNFVEVFVDCSLAVAEQRDPKGLYKKARAGEIKNFTGIDDPYEPPENPEIHLKTDEMTLEDEVHTVIDYLVKNEIIREQYFTRAEDQVDSASTVAV